MGIAVNSQISDAIQSSSAYTVGQSASGSMAFIEAVMAETLSMAMHNSVSAQQQMQLVSNAAVSATCARILNATPPPPPKKDGPSGKHGGGPTPPGPPGPPGPPSPHGPKPMASKISSDIVAAQRAVGVLVQDAQVSKLADTALKGIQKLAGGNADDSAVQQQSGEDPNAESSP